MVVKNKGVITLPEKGLNNNNNNDNDNINNDVGRGGSAPPHLPLCIGLRPAYYYNL